MFLNICGVKSFQKLASIDKWSEECILIIHKEKMQWLHQTIGWFWLAKEQSFFFSSFPAVVFYAVFSHSAKESTWHHAVKQGSTVHAFPITAFIEFPRNEQHIYLLEFHVIWGISLFSITLKTVIEECIFIFQAFSLQQDVLARILDAQTSLLQYRDVRFQTQTSHCKLM